MSLLQAVVMGIIQGLTEFLPVSSSGHLAIFKNVFHLNLETGLFFDVLLHLGTLLAVFVAFFKDIKKLVIEGFGILIDVIVNMVTFFGNIFGGRRNLYRKVIRSNYRKFVLLVIIATIPTGVIGIVARDLVEAAGHSLLIIGMCLFITAILLVVADVTSDGKKIPRDVSYNNGFIIGMCQGLATLPGISRSGTTITACLLSGFERKFAVKFSFIMSIPAILGAMVVEMKDFDSKMLNSGEIGYYLIGMLVSAVIGYICIKTMLVVVRSRKFKFFAFYCIAAGLVCVVYSFI